MASHLDTWIWLDIPAYQKYVDKESPFTPCLDEDGKTRPYGMHTIPESLSRCVGLVNIVPKTRPAHVDTPSKHVKMRIDLRARRRASRSSDDQGRLCVARGPARGVCSDHRGSRRGVRGRCAAQRRRTCGSQLEKS